MFSPLLPLLLLPSPLCLPFPSSPFLQPLCLPGILSGNFGVGGAGACEVEEREARDLLNCAPVQTHVVLVIHRVVLVLVF